MIREEPGDAGPDDGPGAEPALDPRIRRGLSRDREVVTRTVEGPPGNPQVKFEKVTDKARAYHNSYFEMLGEQGWPGLAIWLWLHLLGLWHMERLRWRFRRQQREGGDWRWGLATALQQAHVSYLVGSVFVGIAFQPFAFLLVGVQIALWSYVRRTEVPARRPKVARTTPPAEPAASAS